MRGAEHRGVTPGLCPRTFGLPEPKVVFPEPRSPSSGEELAKNRVYIAKADPQKQVALSKREQLQYDVAG